jgi:hypothetical protein
LHHRGEILGETGVGLHCGDGRTKVHQATGDAPRPRPDLEEDRTRCDAAASPEQLVHPLRVLRAPGVVALGVDAVDATRLGA